ncbi:hypothetical protein [Streptococcus loxodontisalivarius]|uniref:Outer membrane lipoprotein SlyB n=1 Tax=Streptococcus loxodontisalivarius TaxID=1349415 RepID=A0ABS2PU50_9STRE|nr:hypothetical protein [Streptococcus loxodontisalivarius]MBM7643401.1 outer membrane lipoprotein SlyB [Streptococcus loxodontisalivarius]
MTNNASCKKCNRNLPTNYKYKKCESCRNIKIENTKKVVVGTVGAFGVISSLAATINLGGKNKK